MFIKYRKPVGSKKCRGTSTCPIESRYFSDFFVLLVQVRVPSQRQELVPIADEMYI